jgi:hypothetical protein
VRAAARLPGPGRDAVRGRTSGPANRLRYLLRRPGRRRLRGVTSAATQATLPPAECKVALAAGRSLPLGQAASLASSAVYLPPRENGAPTAELQIFSLGQLRVLRQGWVYGKTRALLLYLLHNDGASKAEIGAALWPEASERQLRQNFRMAVYHLRRALGRPAWIVFDGGRYSFNRALDVWHDADAFAALPGPPRRAAPAGHGSLPERPRP